MLSSTMQLYAYWRSLAHGGLPNLRNFHSLSIAALVPHMISVEVHEQFANYRILAVGDSVDASYGSNLAGRRFGEIALGPSTPDILRDYQVCALDRVAILSRQTFLVDAAGPYVHERMLLPFEIGSSGRVGQISAGLFFDRPYPGEAWADAITDWNEEERTVFDLAGNIIDSDRTDPG